MFEDIVAIATRGYGANATGSASLQAPRPSQTPTTKCLTTIAGYAEASIFTIHIARRMPFSISTTTSTAAPAASTRIHALASSGAE